MDQKANMINNFDDFVFQLGVNSESDTDCVIEFLKARGFLIDKKNSIFFLSDNSHSEDRSFLLSILDSYNLGTINQDNSITICNSASTSRLSELFELSERIGGECSGQNYGWGYFFRRECGVKTPVRIMEPYIARYIKAISACCVFTYGCCDGNHNGMNRMEIQISGSSASIWHSLIGELLLRDRFNLCWDKNRLYFSNSTKYDTYYRVNMAARFLYENRIRIRTIKKTAADRFRASHDLSKSSEAEIRESFEKSVRELVKESKNEWI